MNTAANGLSPRILVLGLAACVPLVPACTTHILPTAPIAAQAGALQARVAEITSWGTPAALLVDVESPVEVGLMGLALGDGPNACEGGTALPVARANWGAQRDAFDRVEDILVPLPGIDPELQLPAVLPPGITRLKVPWPPSVPLGGGTVIDVQMRSVATATAVPADRCLRLRLPGPSALGPAWQVRGSRLTAAVGIHLDRPLQPRDGPSGIGLDIEFGRVQGANRLVMRGEVGLAVCGPGCRLEVGRTGNDLYTVAGLGAGYERVVVRANKWSLGVGGGYRLRAHSRVVGETGAFLLHGPFATLRTLRTRPPKANLLDPHARGGYGIEFLVERMASRSVDPVATAVRASVGMVFVFD